MRIAGAIFDLDGVLTNTAALHERSWHEAIGVNHEDYLTHFDGRKRDEGLRRYFAARGDQANEPYMAHLCEHKDAIYHALLKTQGVKAYPDALMIMDALTCPIAVASSSLNAKAVIRSAGLSQRFSVVIDGNGPSKPASFTAAAEAMGVPISECLVVEDSPDALMMAVNAGAKYALFVRKDRT